VNVEERDRWQAGLVIFSRLSPFSFSPPSERFDEPKKATVPMIDVHAYARWLSI
jgi:hypothetical protein